MIDFTSCFAVAAMFGSFGCRLKHNPIEHPPMGAFLYRGYDSAGKLIIRGWLAINAGDAERVEGRWCLDRIGAPDSIGPQLGLGRLLGRLEGTRLSLNLNPGFLDFNVALTGTFDAASFKGTWRYCTIRGIVGEGAFEAIKKKLPAAAER
ncbi:MAG: hypothetical protein NTW97_03620 [Candidatus Krumholzibacteria bacterium]|nr:hypothetical protein [Candidatus Krumholzibacteria bacterium]